ncbi:hypothetical protein KBB96_01530 [Luteolibacter ambystomatis]|uniref:Uncharacterized protein n=1 Tax=Luteolibacter ambystomatis TaxID=2824561 RepID=A0A975J057_9BACT|nr:hypothetical protein [Luteolibacter ambystomatis]QUE51587.1 hypothetical protein KBB96_01530 [Luteolibacter ambystomatis]
MFDCPENKYTLPTRISVITSFSVPLSIRNSRPSCEDAIGGHISRHFPSCPATTFRLDPAKVTETVAPATAHPWIGISVPTGITMWDANGRATERFSARANPDITKKAAARNHMPAS